jgi:hypothetical protein
MGESELMISPPEKSRTVRSPCAVRGAHGAGAAARQGVYINENPPNLPFWVFLVLQ